MNPLQIQIVDYTCFKNFDRVMTLLSKAPSLGIGSWTSSNGTCRRSDHMMNLELLGLEMSYESMHKRARLKTGFKMGPQNDG